jgi:GT2 family glycosyltransferase
VTVPLVSVIVPVRNGARDLPRCLGSIVKSAGPTPPVELIVVDNGSSDDSEAVAIAHGARVLSAPGLKVGAVRNVGVREATGRLIAFVDADNEVGPTWLSGCVDALSSDAVGAAGLPYEAPIDGTWVQRQYDLLRSRPAVRRDTDWLNAGNLAMRRDVFLQLGGFDETLEACEDVDLCARIRRAGLRTVAEPLMTSIHHGDPRTLGALFFGELWRGRDNLRVSLREPLRLRSLPGIVLPVVTLALLVALPLALVAAFFSSRLPLAMVLMALGTIALLRAAVIVRRGRIRPSLSWGRSLAVAAAFEFGRALALLGRATHHTRARPQAA